MESLPNLEFDWPAVPARRLRPEINYALAVSMLLHLVGFAGVVAWWPEPVSRTPAVASRPLSISLNATPVNSTKPESPVQSQATLNQSTPASVEKPAAAPVPAVTRPARKPLSAMIAEAVQEAPVVESEPTSDSHGTVFDPRLRARLTEAKNNNARGGRRDSGITTYTLSNGATHVDLGSGRCFEVRREIAMDNREVWWSTSCPGDD